MKTYPVVLSIAGSDCSGGAGIQADIKTISALGAYAASVITAVTVQNTRGVKAVHIVPAEIVQGQIEAVMEDLRPDALKIGMVSEPALVKIIAGCLLKYPHCPIVYDPIMVSTSGRKLMAKDAIQLIKEELFPLTSLTGKKITTAEEMKEAARQLSEEYHTAVLVKGGHLEGNEMQDVLFTDGNAYIYKEKKIESRNLHGTGCTLSSSIATYLALGLPMDQAVGKAKSYVSKAIDAGKEIIIGHGNGPLCHFWGPEKARIWDDNKVE